MPDTVHHVMWYTVYDDKTDEIIASGTADMIVQQMGYASRNSFFSAVCHAKHKKRQPPAALHLPCGEDPSGGHKRKGRYIMKIIIEEHGDMVSIDFKGPDKHALHAQELLMMATIESMVVKLRTNLTDAEVEDLMDKFGKYMKSSAIARYKLGPTTNMAGFSDKEAAFLSKLFNL